MQFDVIIGNPPYQLNDRGYGRSATPLYHKFVQQAKKLRPRYLTMIIPARWFAGGKGLDRFRQEMLNDDHIRSIHDFPDASDIFPGVQIKGGVCYFLWDRDNKGLCKVTNHVHQGVSVMERPMREEGVDIFIRYNEAISILRKVRSQKEPTMINVVSPRNPFGLRTYFFGEAKPFPGAIKLYQNGGIGWIREDSILTGRELLKKHKVYITKAYGGEGDFPNQVINKPLYGAPNTCCTETYLVIGPFTNEQECRNVISYIQTRFFRFLVLLYKNTQDASRRVYSFVPMQDFSKPWTDEELYKKYGLTQEEIAFIESMVRPMVEEK